MRPVLRCYDLCTRGFYSILHNNPNAVIYIYVFTDFISENRWQNIIKITEKFKNIEIHKVTPQFGHLQRLKNESQAYHGWDLIHISIFYHEYLPDVKYCFNMGIDTVCVGDLQKILRHVTADHYIVGACTSTRHQTRPICKLRNRWLGFDTALINFEALRRDNVTPGVLIKKSVDQVGYIHDEVAFNAIGNCLFLDCDYHYLYTGAYRPKKMLHSDTAIVDFYSELKPWDISVSGYAIFDQYLKYYKAVAKYIDLEYYLPESFKDASDRLKQKKKTRAYWYPIRFRFMSKAIFRVLLIPTYIVNIIGRWRFW